LSKTCFWPEGEPPVNLTERLRRDGRTADTVAAWIRARLDDDWQASWQRQLPALSEAWERIGEPAYGRYNRELFRPIQRDLQAEGLSCDPRLPGNLEYSEERWGPEDFRERRMWTLLLEDDGTALGALVVRFFHDHTELRLPDKPTMEALAESDHDTIRDIVVQDPAQWVRGG
jgi:hypothetical protein